MDEIRENDVVALVTPPPETGLKRGDVGSVVHVFDQTPDHPGGFIVEFVDETGDVVAETDITNPSDVVKLRLDPKGTLEEWAGDVNYVAIVFTDIIGSTDLGRELGQSQWFDLLQTHFLCARKMTNTFQGHEINVIGDSYMVAFHTTVAAFDFALAFQRNTGDERIKIRAGVHVGPARIIDDDILGIDDDILGLMIHHRPRVPLKSSFKPWLFLSNDAKTHLDWEKTSRHSWLDFMREEVSFPGSSEKWQLWYVLLSGTYPGSEGEGS